MPPLETNFLFCVFANEAVLEGLQFPYVRFDEKGELDFGMKEAVYDEFPGMRWSGFLHRMEVVNCEKEEKITQKS